MIGGVISNARTSFTVIDKWQGIGLRISGEAHI
jgi:hypothetical protein